MEVLEEVLVEEEFKVDFKQIPSFFNGLKPTRRINPSEWAEAYRHLGPGVSNMPGPWRNNVTPYLVPIMDALGVFQGFKEVVFMKGTQIAATSAGENATGYWMHITPAPILIMFPTISVARRNSKRRIAPLIDDSAVLRKIVSPAKSRDGGNTTLEKDFPGGNILLCGANSPSDLRSVNIRFCIFDEIDEYPQDLEEQGDPIEIAKKRTSTYDTNKKMFYISTPKIKNTSHIEKLFLDTDQHHCYLPCPHCAADAPKTKLEFEHCFAKTPPPGYQKLVLEQFRFTEGNAAAVYYECIHCQKEIHNHHKAFMLPRFLWVPEHPEKSNPEKIGFHLSAFYSPIGFFSWPTMAGDYSKALKDSIKMKTFVQTTLGMPYEEEGTQPAYEKLFERSLNSPYQTEDIPDGVHFLTAGIDIQKDRAEVEIVGWGLGKRSWSISYRQYLGRPEENGLWQQLTGLLSETWVRKSDGVMMGLSMTLIDEGYSKNEVYAFALRMGLSRILPCKGSQSQATPISTPSAVYIKRDGKKSETLKHITISTDFYKSALYAHLNLPRTDETGAEGPESYCHFPNNYVMEHYKRLTIEKKVTTPNSRGFDTSEWVKPPGARNEQLDCRVYATAAATLLGIDRFTEADYLRMSGFTPVKKDKPKNKQGGGLPELGNLPDL